jgi:hypothetical protein
MRLGGVTTNAGDPVYRQSSHEQQWRWVCPLKECETDVLRDGPPAE